MGRISNWDEFVNEGKNNSEEIVIKTPQDVEKFILDLAKAGDIYHFDDSAHTIVSTGSNDPIFTTEEADRLDAAMEKSFEICEKTFGKHGFWEGFIKGVFVGYIAFGAGDTVYVIAGNGGKGKVKVTTLEDYDKMQADTNSDDSDNADEKKIDEWFRKLKTV